MKFALIPAFLALAMPAWTCPMLEDHAVQLDPVYDKLSTAPSPEVAQSLTGELWQIWLKAPDDLAQRMLDDGMQFRQLGNLESSEQILTMLIDYCPNYAEGYNQRAFTRYLAQNFQGAIPDLERTLEIRPRHLGALSGKALTHTALEDVDSALPLLREMVRLNPWAQERSMVESLGTEL